MCRCKDEHSGGRRCPSDNSETRRLRKHNATAKTKFQIVSRPVQASETNILTNPTTTTPDINNIKSHVILMEDMKSVLTTRDRDAKNVFLLPDGSSLETGDYWAELKNSEGELIKKGTIFEILVPEMEKITTLIGSQVNILAEEKSDLKDADILQEETEKLEKSKQEEIKVKKFQQEIIDEAVAKYGDLSQFYKKSQSGDDEAKKLYLEYDKRTSALYAAQSEVNKYSRNGSPEAWAKISRQRNELLNILKEIRPFGGNITVADNSHKPVVKILQEVSSFYPQAWIEDSNNATPPRIKKTTKRAHYSNGSYQNKFKVALSLDSTLKPADWKPNPERMSDLGTWIKMDENNSWTNPETGMKYQHYTRPGEHGWMHSKVEVHRPSSYQPEDPNVAPYGKGWKQAIVIEEKYNPETRKIEDTGNKITVWYREANKRVRVESVSQPEITISGSNEEAQKRVALHEFAHRIEASGKTGNHITRMEEAFLVRRTTNTQNGEREKLEKIYPGTKEYGRADSFIDLYMGKEYTDSYREVLSTGAEGLFSKSFGGFAGLAGSKSDPDMKNFLIGLWASA